MHLIELANVFFQDETSSKRSFRDRKQEITASVIEEELLRSSMNQLRVSEPQRPVFPIANAVRECTRCGFCLFDEFLFFSTFPITGNVALGFATKVATGAQAFMEATHEAMEGEDTLTLSQVHVLHTSKDSDDEDG